MNQDWERILISAYARNLSLALPITILVLKLVVRVVSRERNKDIFRSILTLPLDFVYIAMALILAAGARRDSALVTRYGSGGELDMAIVVLMVVLISSAVMITLCDRWVRMMWGKFYAAWKLLHEERMRIVNSSVSHNVPVPISGSGQMPLNLAATADQENTPTLSRRAALLIAWILVYWLVMIPLVFTELAIGTVCLGLILQRLK